ncbi:GntR family transcriptional regulator [Flammeovirga pectinis]|uniref:GntR family transcriptional regulator n=2 Tax=Flammeovirga pectinis TaxID=2494373 RepID=A0A3Q9FQ39_9BACT|nr:GntR family transcriptional regulator [Flammeovirga pectinis]
MEELEKQLQDNFLEECKIKAPKYIQLSNTFKSLISMGVLENGDQMPSFNELLMIIDVSKDTIEKAYKILKEEGYVISIRGKGTFVKEGLGNGKPKVLLIFNKMSSSKKKVYESFVATAKDKLDVNLLLHNGSLEHLEQIIIEQKNNYHYFAVFPIFNFANDLAIEKVIKLLPKNQLILLGKEVKNLTNSVIPSVYENFSEDIFEVLQQHIKSVIHFDKLHLVLAKDSNKSLHDIWSGFVRFCVHFNLAYDVSSTFERGKIKKNTLYIVAEDLDLTNIIKDTRDNNYQLGKDIAIISYNDSPLKEIVEGGITVISASFSEMGEITANQIINKKLEKVKVPFLMKRRNSF